MVQSLDLGFLLAFAGDTLVQDVIDMDQMAAMNETVALYERRRAERWSDENPAATDQEPGDPCGAVHLREMRMQMAVGGMSPAKMGRWLGWAQCSVLARGYATLDEMKEINRRHAG